MGLVIIDRIFEVVYDDGFIRQLIELQILIIKCYAF